jgi:hypothetical protein
MAARLGSPSAVPIDARAWVARRSVSCTMIPK